MRKQFFYAALAIALMSSCSKDKDPGTITEPENPTPGVVDEDTPVAIELGIGNPSLVVTRGTGSVGDLEGDAKNLWNSQQLKVYMFPKNKIGTAYEATSPLANLAFKAPATGQSGKVIIADGTVPYYPMQDAFDFYAYHMDTETGNANPAAVIGDGNFTVTGKIDGTNDVMAAIASVSPTNQATLLTKYYEKTTAKTFKVDADGKTVVTDAGAALSDEEQVVLAKEIQKAFSSYAARRTIQPSLTFQHLLTRLKFNVKAGEASAAKDGYTTVDNQLPGHDFPDLSALTDEQKTKLNNGEIIDFAPTGTTNTDVDGAVYIQSINVLDQQDNVVLTFTPGTAPTFTDNAITAAATLPTCTPVFSVSDPSVAFTLMGRAATGADVTQPTSATDLVPTATEELASATPVGESMMIVPKQESFKIQILVMQYVITKEAIVGVGTADSPEFPAEYKWKLSQMTSTVKAPATMPDPAKGPSPIESTDKNEAGNFIFAASKSYNINITVYSYQKIEIDAILTGWIPGSDGEVNPGDDAFGE